ncbi:hypothetical protein ACSBL2_10765 [Pedobacter sp. AW31-3R]|uniref:hypothetical protein n=1 Tax=Pedobacter sp. AW31-3R TaxID=3445781 RepID=UPI003FA195DC
MKRIFTGHTRVQLMLFLLCPIALNFLNSCKGEGKKITVNGVTYTNYNVKAKDTTYYDIKNNKYKFLGMIPDSLRTSEQQKVINAIKDILLNGVAVENNKQVLKFSKEECAARGLPANYYEELKNNIRTNNSYFEAYGIKDVAGMKAEQDSSLKGQIK